MSEKRHVVTCTVLWLGENPDINGDIFPVDAEITWRKTGVPVILNFGRAPEDCYGIAKLYRLCDRLTAEIEFFQKIDFELLKVLHPVVGGFLVEREGNKITKLRVTSIGLTTSPVDSNIPPVSEGESIE